MISDEIVPSSCRDPAGFVVRRNGRLLRCLKLPYVEHYKHLMQSGLYKRLVEEGLLIPHVEVEGETSGSFMAIEPDLVPFVSYPYEWSFSQLKAAAITTLKIQQQALDSSMILKDASAYNIQFVAGKAVLIDTASFEKYQEGKPWIAYGQFCRHFLAPLALMCYKDIRLNRLLQINLDGIPLDLAASLLPFRARFNAGIAYHILVHATVDRAAQSLKKKDVNKSLQLSKQSFVSQIDHLIKVVERLELPDLKSHWSAYYKENNYSDQSFEHKKSLVSEFLDLLKPTTRVLFDLGANVGMFSRMAAAKQMLTVSLDLDPICVDLNYRECVKNAEGRILPLTMDLTMPSPSLGFFNQEHQSLTERGPADACLALALIHHLAIANTLPLELIARFMDSICKSSLIIEFVPKEDFQVQRLLSMRQDIFPDYTQEGFEAAYSKFFDIKRSEPISGSERRLYLMSKKNTTGETATMAD